MDDLRLGSFFGSERPRLTVLGSLAAGADQIGASTALEQAHPDSRVEVELEAVLPFSEADYPGDPQHPKPEFRPDEAQTLVRLAERASQVVRLDGRYDDDEHRHIGYEQCREVLLHHADLIVAIYDPLAKGSRGGTVETLEIALTEGVPAVAVLVHDEEARIALYRTTMDRPGTAAEEWRQAHSISSDEWRGAVRDEIRHLLALPYQLSPPDETQDERRKRQKSLAVGVSRLRLMYDEAPAHGWCRGSILRRIFSTAWTSVLAVGGWFAPPKAKEPLTSGEHARDDIILPPYAAYYDRASELAAAYMETYRGAFVLAFLLAGVAVATAVALLVIGREPPLAAILFFGLLKIGIILFLIFLERVSYQERYQEHATDLRYLAEQLRPMQWLAPMGTRVAAVNLPAHLAPFDPRQGWMPWLVRAVARSAPLICGPARLEASGRAGPPAPRKWNLDGQYTAAMLERVRSEWVQGQVHYHRNNMDRMHSIDKGLERLAKILLWTVLTFATVALLLKLLYRFGIADTGQLPFLLGAGTAVLPAFIAALAGIMFQSEARRLQHRSEAMYHALRVRQQELEQQIAALGAEPESHPSAFWVAAQYLRNLSAMMIEEIGDWKVLYQTHEIHAG